MRRKRLFPGQLYLVLFLVFLASVSSNSLAEVGKRPSVIMLFKSVAEISDSESMALLDIVCNAFADSGALSPIEVEPKRIFWPSIEKAASFSLDKWADYMVYMVLSKKGIQYFYDAKLVTPKTISIVDMYNDSWPDDPMANKIAMFRLASNVIFTSTKKITVHMTIESSPNYCDVYKDENRLGHTDKDKGFRNTYYWDKGTYKIMLCKPKYRDNVDTLEVKKNPTRYQKYVNLKPK